MSHVEEELSFFISLCQLAEGKFCSSVPHQPSFHLSNSQVSTQVVDCQQKMPGRDIPIPIPQEATCNQEAYAAFNLQNITGTPSHLLKFRGGGAEGANRGIFKQARFLVQCLTYDLLS